MTKWPYSKIADHKDKALERFTEQYVGAENLKNLVKLSADRSQILEEAIWDLLTLRTLKESFGQQLDLLGAIFGEMRLSRGDSEYRDAIFLRITLNLSSGDPETILAFLKSLSGADTIILKETFPASLEIFVSEELSMGVIEQIRSITAVSIGSIFISSTDGETPFGTQETGLPNPTDIAGFGELGIHEFELDDGATLEFFSSGAAFDSGLTDFEDPILPEEGGVIAEVVAI